MDLNLISKTRQQQSCDTDGLCCVLKLWDRENKASAPLLQPDSRLLISL